MNWDNLISSLQNSLGDSLPGILGAIVILVVGWFFAILIRAAVRRGLAAIGLNEKIRAGTGSTMDIRSGAASLGYYLILLLTLVAFFEALNLRLASAPLQSLLDQVFAFVPRLIGGGILALIAWLLAILLRRLATEALARTTLDERISTQAGMRPISESLGQVLYWVVILLFLPGILAAVGLQGLLDPVQGMVDKALNMVPNIVAAAALGIVGWFIAKLLRQLVESLLAAAGADGLGERIGFQARMPLSRLAGLIVLVVVFVPALIAAFDALRIDAVSRPATQMLGTVMSAVPGLIGAGVVLAVAFFLARFIGSLISGLLEGVGVDSWPARIGLGAQFAGAPAISMIAGRVAAFFILLFASAEAAGMLGLSKVSDLVGTFIEFSGRVLLGFLIIALGLWIGNLAHGAVSALGSGNAPALAGLARIAIIAIVVAMGLRSMGIADDIINLAFGLTLGAVAVAVALSFGLGGREAAGRQMEHWLGRLRGE